VGSPCTDRCGQRHLPGHERTPACRGRCRPDIVAALIGAGRAPSRLGSLDIDTSLPTEPGTPWAKKAQAVFAQAASVKHSYSNALLKIFKTADYLRGLAALHSFTGFRAVDTIHAALQFLAAHGRK